MLSRVLCLVLLLILGCEGDAPAPAAAPTSAVKVSLESLYDVEQTLKKWAQLTSTQRTDVTARLVTRAQVEAAKAKKTADLLTWMTMLHGQRASRGADAAVKALALFEKRFDALGEAELEAAKKAGALGALLRNATSLRRKDLVRRIGTRLDPLCKLKKRSLDLTKYLARYLCATGKPLLFKAKHTTDARARHALALVTDPVQKRLGHSIDSQLDDHRAIITIAVKPLSAPAAGKYPCEATVEAVHDANISAVYKGACTKR